MTTMLNGDAISKQRSPYGSFASRGIGHLPEEWPQRGNGGTSMCVDGRRSCIAPIQ